MKAATNQTFRNNPVAEFQSTPPVKAATVFTEGTDIPLIISIHAAREGGDCIRRNRIHGDRISIHAAREGGDEDKMKASWIRGISIHAAREGGDSVKRVQQLNRNISIHAAREGGDDDG